VTALLFAHIGGLPIEETLASSGPALLVALGAVAAKLRARYHRSKETGAQDASPLP
jgi:hypothetical protein